MRIIVFLAAATIVTNMAAASATPVKPDAASARIYVEWLYNSERDDLLEVFGDNESQFFDASTLALLRQDRKLLNGEEGAISSDFLCGCQDPGSMHAILGNVAMTGASAAKADVAVQFTAEAGKAVQLKAEAGQPVTHVIIDLAFENGAWRLHDIHTRVPESSVWDGLRDVLTGEIAALSAHH